MISGGILLWSGTIATIPAGFVLCDGNNSTPDLRDKFIVGSGTTYSPGDNAPNSIHVHSPFVNFSDGVGAPLSAAGIENPASNLPPYYSLAYIMKT